MRLYLDLLQRKHSFIDVFLIFRTSLEVLQRNNFIPLHIYSTLCFSARNRDGSEGFPTEQGYLVTDVRGIFELFLDLDPRSPCLALFPHPWFPSSWALLPVWHACACESSLWSLSSCLFTCSLVPEIGVLSLPTRKWYLRVKMISGLLPGIGLGPHIQCQNLIFLVSLWSLLLTFHFVFCYI